MSDRRGSRFVLEVLFLLALAVALTLTNLAPFEIAAIMLVGWVVVALFEWAAWRDEPHYGSGLPPRYYVPQVNLPPAQPLEQVATGYPEVRDEAPTWIASAALREEMLGEWPVAAPPVSAPPISEPPVSAPPLSLPDPWTVQELPAAPLDELEEPAQVSDTIREAEPEPESERVSDTSSAPEPHFDPEPVSDTEPEPEPVSDTVREAEPESESERVSDTSAAPEPHFDPEPVSDTVPSLHVELVRSVQGVARYSLDPLAEPAPRKRFGRGAVAEVPGVEVPSRPEGLRPLPGRANRQD